MQRRSFLSGSIALAATAVAGTTNSRAAQSDDMRFFRILTGSAATTTFPVGTVIASAISNPAGSRPCERGGSCGVPGLIAVALTSAGSLANIAAVASGSIESGFAQADLVHSAFNGEGVYFRRARQPNLRVIANLYPETVHLVARKDSGISDIRDLVGKRVSLDRAGSGLRFNAEIILNAYNVRIAQIKVLEVDPGEAADRLLRGELDAFFVVAGHPAQLVADLLGAGAAEVIPLAAKAIEAALRRHRFFVRQVIPADAYPGQPETETLGIGMQWVVSESVDADLVQSITAALWHPANRRLLDGRNTKALEVRRETALTGISIPLHAGAERFYRQAGMLG